MIEIVTMDDSGVTNTPLENVDIVTYAEILNALAAGDVKLISWG